jgi:tetratricopeptide (TPR) repeat protein
MGIGANHHIMGAITADCRRCRVALTRVGFTWTETDMSLRRTFILAAMVAAVGLAGGVIFAKGGGGGGHGGGMKGGWKGGNYQKPKPTVDPKKLQEELDKKVKKFVADGFSALRAGDTAAAFEAFSDALQLNPNAPDAHLGMGLTRAAKANYSGAQTELETAMRLKADPRLTLYDLAIAYVRAGSIGRAAVLLNRHLAETKPPEELIINAQLALLSTLDEKQKKQIAVLPDLLKTLSNANLTLASAKHAGMVRWGLSWVSSGEVQQNRASGKKEIFPARLPFLLPGDFALPEAGQPAIAANVLFPDDGGAPAAEPVAVKEPAAAKEDAKPAAEPDAVASAKPSGPFKLGGSGADTSAATPDVPAAPGRGSAGPSVANVNPPAIAPSSVSSPVTRTVRGAAFAVGPDLLLTAARLLTNAREIQLQDEQGKRTDATVVAVDEQTGVALIRARGAAFKPMALADAAKAGPVGVAAFVKPSVFNPDLNVITGQLIGPADKLALRCSVHPRSAGSPFFDENGRVLGLVVAARDDSLEHLPVVTVEVIRQFAQGRFEPASTTTGEPADSVVEMTVTRQE